MGRRPAGAFSSRSTRPVVAQAVRELADAAASGLPSAWARAVRESARRGAAGLPEVLDEVMEVCAWGADAARAASVAASMTDVALGMDAASSAKDTTAPTVPVQQSSAEAQGQENGWGIGNDGGRQSAKDERPERRTEAAAGFGPEVCRRRQPDRRPLRRRGRGARAGAPDPRRESRVHPGTQLPSPDSGCCSPSRRLELSGRSR